MLPLIGRIADLRGRVPVLVMSLVVFAVGSLVTALAYDLPSMVAGRFLQGVGGGGLVPATLALVADLYPVERRGVPLGIVSAVQEIGSVIGPLFGAVVLAARRLAGDLRDQPRRRPGAGRRDPAASRAGDGVRAPPHAWPPGLARLVLLLRSPWWPGRSRWPSRPPLQRDLTWGQLFIPFAGDGRWLTPIGVTAMVAGAGCSSVRCLFAEAPAGRPARLVRAASGEADLVGALLLAARARRRDPRVRHRRPRGAGLLRPGARGSCSAPPSRPSPSSCTCAAPTRRWSRAARSGRYAGLGLAAGQLLRRGRADRGADRHPDLRPHHDLPRRRS